MTVSAIFPSLAGVAFPVLRTPIWNTLTHQAVSGKKTTLGRFSYPLYRFELSFSAGDGGFLRSSTTKLEFQELISFYNSVGGMRDLFRYLDPERPTATAQIFGTGDSTATDFQLLYTTSGTVSSWSDPVFASTSTAIFINGSSVSSTSYSIGDTGLVTFSTILSTSQVASWSGTPWWLARFTEDSATFEKFMLNLFEYRKCSFESEKF